MDLAIFTNAIFELGVDEWLICVRCPREQGSFNHFSLRAKTDGCGTRVSAEEN
jgi:hypothetical protein